MKRLSAARGFTLIELIVVIVVLGILSGIAIAGYTAVIRRANESSVLRTSETIARELTTLGVQKAGNASQTGSSADKTSRESSIVWEFLASGDLPSGYSVAIEGSAGTPILLQRADGIAPVPAVTLAAIHSTPRYLSVARAGASVCVQLSADGTQGGDDGWKVVGRRNGIGACDDTTIGAPSLQYPQAANLLAWSALLTNTGSGSNAGTKNLDANGAAAPAPTVAPAPTPLALSYAQTAIPVTGSSAALSPTVSGGSGSYSYSYSGVLPAGVTFSTVTGAFSTTGLAGSSTGALDTTFLSGLTGANLTVSAIVTQPDGKILIGGNFTGVNGTARSRIARLNTDGTLDTTFLNGLTGANMYVYAIALQPDGKIVFAGEFTNVNGVTRNRIARLNADGSLDTSFGNGLALADNGVNAVALQPDGKILIVGQFTQVNGVIKGRIARLNADGTLDTSFGNGLVGANLDVQNIALQPDGKIVIAGYFSAVNSLGRASVARLNADGSTDTTFGNANVGDFVFGMALQPDGKILIGGQFTTAGGATRSRIARFNANGTLDTTFGNGLALANNIVRRIVLQPDGKIVIGGDFSAVNGVARSYVARLNADGSTDTTFVVGLVGTYDVIAALALQPDGKIFIGATACTCNSPRRHFFRLNNATAPFASTPITVTVTSGALSETTTFSLTPT